MLGIKHCHYSLLLFKHGIRCHFYFLPRSWWAWAPKLPGHQHGLLHRSSASAAIPVSYVTEDFPKLILFANLCFLSDFSKEQLICLSLYEGLISSQWQTKQVAIFMTQTFARNFLPVPTSGRNIPGKYQEKLFLKTPLLPCHYR